MRCLTIAPALTATLLLAACADAPRTVALPAAPQTPTAAVLDGQGSGGELADARNALDTLNAGSARPAPAAHAPLLGVARAAFACWEAEAATAPRLSAEATACRADFWGAVHALTPEHEVAAR